MASQEFLINFECDEVEKLSAKELGNIFEDVLSGSTSLFLRYGVYRSLVSNSEMKYEKRFLGQLGDPTWARGCARSH